MDVNKTPSNASQLNTLPFWKCRFEWIQGRWWNGLGDWNWPFVVHFVGCKPCGGKYASYDRDTCVQGMKR